MDEAHSDSESGSLSSESKRSLSHASVDLPCGITTESLHTDSSTSSSESQSESTELNTLIRTSSFDDLIAPSPNLHLYQTRLHEVICKALQNVPDHSLQRKSKLEELFNDLSSRVATRVRQHLGETTPYHYYEVLADLYYFYPDQVKVLMKIGSQTLWDNYQYEIICCLLLYKWLFGYSTKNSLFHAFIKGCHRLFSMDIESRTLTFQPVFHFLYSEVLLNTKYWQSPAVREFMIDIFSLVAQYYFYYFSSKSQQDLQYFLSQTSTNFSTHEIQALKGHAKFHTLNMFVNEIVRKLRQLKEERILILYLKSCEMFIGPLEIPGRKTNLRMHSVLLDNMTPGSPLYPTRLIRKQAGKAINLLYPKGRLPRAIVSYGFRLLHPVELARSWYFWFRSILWVSFFLFGRSYRRLCRFFVAAVRGRRRFTVDCLPQPKDHKSGQFLSVFGCSLEHL